MTNGQLKSEITDSYRVRFVYIYFTELAHNSIGVCAYSYRLVEA